ncbi:hypothetical protein BH10BAC5_BH10BAC5_00520 [soil metagenome]
MKTTLLLIIVFIICNSRVRSQTSDFKPEIKFGSTIFTGWEFNSGNDNFITSLDSSTANPNSAFGNDPTKHQFETSQNSFFLERAYLTMLGTLSQNIKARITTDIYSLTDGTSKTQYQLGLKFAWVNWTAFKSDNGTALDLSAGIIPNQWILLNDKYFGNRGLAKSLSDFQWITSASKSANSSSGTYSVSRSNSSYFSAADLGANLTFSGPKGIGELYLNVFNGNGFRNIGFDNRFKDVEVLAFVHPLIKSISARKKREGISELTFGGFAYIGKLGLGENFTPGAAQYKRNRFGGMMNFKFAFAKAGSIKLGSEYSMLSNTDPTPSAPTTELNVTSSGVSAFLEFNPPVESLSDKLFLIARYDTFDPNTANDAVSTIGFNNNTDNQTFMMLGLAYKPSKIATLGVSYQQLGYQLPYIVNYDGTTSKTDSKMIFHVMLDF